MRNGGCCPRYVYRCEVNTVNLKNIIHIMQLRILNYLTDLRIGAQLQRLSVITEYHFISLFKNQKFKQYRPFRQQSGSKLIQIGSYSTLF